MLPCISIHCMRLGYNGCFTTVLTQDNMQKKSILTVQQTQQLLNNIDQVYICKHIKALQGRARFTTCPDSTCNEFQTTYYSCMLVYKVYCSKTIIRQNYFFEVIIFSRYSLHLCYGTSLLKTNSFFKQLKVLCFKLVMNKLRLL